MKKLLIPFLFCTLTMFAQESNNNGIQFEHGTWKEALAKAQKENKLIMLDAYASWCGPCKWMTKNIFTQASVGEFYNKNFVNIKIDMEKGEGIELAKKYGVMAYPTFFFIDAKGNIIHRSCGGQEAVDFINTGKEALDPARQLSTLKKKFESDNRNSELALSYFDAAEKGCMDVEEDVKQYLGNIKSETYAEKSNFALIDKFVNDYKHKSFLYLLSDYDKVVAVNGKEAVDNKILSVYRNNILIAGRKRDEGSLKDIRTAYRAQKNAPVEWLDAYSKMQWAAFTNDTIGFFPATIAFTDKFMMNDAQALNSSAWDFYERTNKKEYLEKAEQWAKKSVELEPGYANMDTYASVLFKLEKYKEAKEVMLNAIEIGKKDGQDTKASEQLLKEIEGKLKS